MTSNHDIGLLLGSGQLSLKKNELNRIKKLKRDSIEAKNILPLLIEYFQQESNRQLNLLTAGIIVRFADRVYDIPSLVSTLGSGLLRAGTRDQYHSVLISLRIAAEVGWELADINLFLIELMTTQWLTYVLDIFIAQAEHGIDILAVSSFEQIGLWEILRLTLEFQAKNGDVRYKCLQLVLADSQFRSNNIEYYAPDIEIAFKDERMSDRFKVLAAACYQKLHQLRDGILIDLGVSQ